MTLEDDLTPHLGRIRDIGRSGDKRFGAQVKRAARQLGRKRSSKSYTGRQTGIGGAKARQFAFQSSRLADFRMRRVVAKVHIARSGRGSGAGAFRAHVNYIQRDGVERDGAGGDIYTREGRETNASSFLDRSSEDRHQFRVIISPEDGEKLDDFKSYTRDLMNCVEKDLGTHLDWVAVDHFNTGHPHTHIVIRGKDQRGKDLVIAPDYIKSGFRHRASSLATERLGPRRDIDIARAQYSEISKDRFTGIDRAIQADLNGQELVLGDKTNTASDRYQRSLRLQRLKHLKALGLAREVSNGRWQLNPGWRETLQELGRRGDVIRSLSAESGIKDGVERLQTYRLTDTAKERLIGEVVTNLPNDELRGTRTLVVDDMSGRRWIVDAGRAEPGTLPPDGAIVEISPKPIRLGAADRVIADIAAQSGGLYSDDIHKRYDPQSSSEYRRAHVRRLEAMRRSGFVDRRKDGVWQVPPDYLERTAKYARKKDGALSIKVRSWISLESQVSHRGPTWLDDPNSNLDAARYKQAIQDRRSWLQIHGWLDQRQDQLTPDAAAKLSAAELRAVTARLANHSNREVKHLDVGEKLQGRYEGAVNLGHTRLAIIGNAKEFALVPWRRDIERYRGREMIARRTVSGMSWTLGRQRGLGLPR